VPGWADRLPNSGPTLPGVPRPPRPERTRGPEAAATRRWGSVARHGTRVLQEEGTSSAPAGGRRAAGGPARRSLQRSQIDREPERNNREIWRDEGPAGPPGAAERRRGGRRGGARLGGPEPVLPADVVRELAEAVGGGRGARLAERLEAAARAYAQDRYPEALRTTRSLVSQVPGSAAARELHGLACYRLGRYGEALRHLEAARRLAGGDPSQLPVEMDCHRALGHHGRVRELWEELRSASPGAEVMGEGRLVLAAEMADQGDIEGATRLLVEAGAGRNLRHPAPRHVRAWYVLADLAERAGDLARARQLFARVAEADPELADAAARLAALGRPPGREGPRRRAGHPPGPRRRPGG
jgi:tetratricopeptide (TPR) repeat protein